MFSKFQEQFKKSSAPANSLFAANAKLMEKMSEQQTELFSGVISDSVKLMDSCADQSELKGLLAAQSMFAQAFRDRITSASKTTYSTLNDMSHEYTAFMKQSFETASEVTKEVAEQAAQQTKTATAIEKPVKKATAKKAPAKKAAAKKAPVKKAAAKPKAVTTKAPVKAEPKIEAKAPTKEAAPAPAKTATKPVATLSADEVKASTTNKPSPTPKTSN